MGRIVSVWSRWGTPLTPFGEKSSNRVVVGKRSRRRGCAAHDAPPGRDPAASMTGASRTPHPFVIHNQVFLLSETAPGIHAMGMNLLHRTLRRLGSAAPRRQLYALSCTIQDVKGALADGSVERIGRSWIVLPDVHPTIRTALQAGAILAGRSALRSHGVWTTESTPIAVASKSNCDLKPSDAPLERHWGPFEVAHERWRVSLPDALAQYIPSVPIADAVATLDSILHNQVATLDTVERALHQMPSRCRELIKLVDAKAGSGLESLFRVALIQRGHRVVSQAPIPGGDGRHSDLRIDDWLYLEVDGISHHSSPAQVAEDHERNHLVVEAGGRWHRFSYRDLMNNMDRCIAIVEAMLQDPPSAIGRRRAS